MTNAGPNAAPTDLSEEFLALLCCPLCDERPPLRLAEDRERLVCDARGHAFPIVDGFPDLRPTQEGLAAAAADPRAKNP